MWGRDIYIDERTVDVHVGRLRRALNRGRASDPIRTVRGAGYSFDERFGKSAYGPTVACAASTNRDGPHVTKVPACAARKPGYALLMTFRLEEATIDELHPAIRSGETTCVAVVRHYIERVRAYNGVASLLVTEDGAPVAEAAGAVRGGAPLRFPTETVQGLRRSCPISTSTRARRSNTAAWSRPRPTRRCSSSSA